jgi:hypothetical protein
MSDVTVVETFMAYFLVLYLLWQLLEIGFFLLVYRYRNIWKQRSETQAYIGAKSVLTMRS